MKVYTQSDPNLDLFKSLKFNLAKYGLNVMIVKQDLLIIYSIIGLNLLWRISVHWIPCTYLYSGGFFFSYLTTKWDQEPRSLCWYSLTSSCFTLTDNSDSLFFRPPVNRILQFEISSHLQFEISSHQLFDCLFLWVDVLFIFFPFSSNKYCMYLLWH